MNLETFIGETQARMMALMRRSRRTINELADALGLTDNAVRNHVAALSRDGIIEDAGLVRDTGGKPARLYSLTREGEEYFPKAYALILRELIEELARNEGRERTIELLRAVGTRVAQEAPATGDQGERVKAAADLLRAVGADIEVQKTTEGWRLQGYGCPLSAVTAERAEACAMVTALVENVTGPVVTECCDRSNRPRCAFLVEQRNG